jgi:hypothetical protein
MCNAELSNSLKEVDQTDLVAGRKYLMVDTNHAIVVTAIDRGSYMVLAVEKSFLVGFFAMIHSELPINHALGQVKFFEIEED